jgi:hypothetical protein
VDESQTTLKPESAEGKQILQYGKDFVAMDTHRIQRGASGKLVFAGYGVTAPEQAYDDYSARCKGKIAVMLLFEALLHSHRLCAPIIPTTKSNVPMRLPTVRSAPIPKFARN